MTQPRIAVLGLGIMGRGIALNFLKNNYDVTVWNRSKEKAIELADKGAHVAHTPADATKNADYIFDVTANDESSRYIFCDKTDGIFATATKHQILITCATLSLSWTLELADLCIEKGFTFFDMPMTGSRAGAESGKLTLLVGGDKNKLNEIEEHLTAISESRPYFGVAGSGMKFKLVLNAIQAAHVIAFGDAMRQARAVGINLDATGTALSEKPGGYPTNMSWNNYQNPPTQTNFSVKWILKDLKYTKEMLADSDFVSPVDPTILDVSIAVLQRAADAGRGDEDWTIVNQ